MTLKKERKLREIKNGPIDFDVTVPPGAHFRDWRPFAVQKLQKRESFFNKKRFTVYRRIIEQYQKSSGDEHHFVDFDSILAGIRRDFTTAMQHDISNWKSPAHIAAPKRGHLIFRDYFQSCRNSWDQRKVKLLCDYLFLAMLEQAQRIFGGQSICFYSTFQAMLEAKIQIPNSMDKLMIPKAVCILLNQQHHELMPMHTVSHTANRKHETNKRGSRTREHMLQCLSDKLLDCSASQTETGLPPENNAANQEQSRAADAFMSLSNDVGYDFEHWQQTQPPPPVPGRHDNDEDHPRTFAEVQPPTLHSSNITTPSEPGNAYNEETRRVWDGPEFVNDISIQGSMPSHPMRISAHYYTPYNIARPSSYDW
eukprot:CAMPEP_0197037968 /NCGR_PEP_ID=MMETSP1384-20130603/15039_1 /TAXON_ID=29189 /ORGANISM="Ammonia sp." /LENGTH=366 /DNA_ID=CAMNT_0042468353 /DNA_START=52 /DNA_END=1149 /DNA_ORIENTATION=+